MKWKIQYRRRLVYLSTLLWHSLPEKIVKKYSFIHILEQMTMTIIVFIHPLIYLTISKYSFIHYFQLQIVLFGGNDYFLCALYWLCILMYFSLVPQTNCQCSSPQPPQPHPEPACTKRSISTPPSVGSYRLLYFFCRPSARASFCSQSCAIGVLVWL